MFLSIKVITNAAKNEIIPKEKGEWLVKVTSSPERGKANKKVMEILSEHLRVPRSSILVVKGRYCSRKILNIITPVPAEK